MSKKKFIPIIILVFGIYGCLNQSNTTKNKTIEELTSNIKGKGVEFKIEFQAGGAFNYPSFAFWLETLDGKFIQSLYVSKFAATGIYGHGDAGNGEWKKEKGEARRPGALPYWSHKRGIKANDGGYMPDPEHRVVDAFTGATPNGNFVLKTKSNTNLPEKFKILMEINQPWDWNEYWTTNKYGNNIDYKTSSQPSLIYAVTINQNSKMNEYFLNPIGHGHYAGEDGELYTNISTITTAKDITKLVKVTIIK